MTVERMSGRNLGSKNKQKRPLLPLLVRRPSNSNDLSVFCLMLDIQLKLEWYSARNPCARTSACPSMKNRRNGLIALDSNCKKEIASDNNEHTD